MITICNHIDKVVKGTSSIKSVKSTPSHIKEISYLLVGDKLNTITLLIVLECLKDRAFHIPRNPQFHNASLVVSCAVFT